MALAHVAVAVADLEQAAEIYRALGFQIGAAEDVEREQVRLRKATKDGLCFELIAANPAGTGSVAKFLERRGPGLHHVALGSEDLESDLQNLKKCGISPLQGYPAKGSNGSQVAFLDPKSTGGVLIELVQAAQTD